MTPSVTNIPRIAAEEFKIELKNPTIWISISEPGEGDTIASNPILDKLPKLKIPLWDLTKEVEYQVKIIGPPTHKDARRIVDFILSYPEHHVIVNCAAGISRSGAVAQFCQDFLGCRWNEYTKRMAVPNSVLYRRMAEYWFEPILGM